MAWNSEKEHVGSDTERCKAFSKFETSSQHHVNYFNNNRNSKLRKICFGFLIVLIVFEVPRCVLGHTPPAPAAFTGSSNSITNKNKIADRSESLHKNSLNDYSGEFLGDYIAPPPQHPPLIKSKPHSKHHHNRNIN